MPPGALARKISARNSQLLFGRIVSSGDWDAATAVPPATAQDGQFWKATSAGTYGGATIPNGALCLFSENLTVVHYLVQEAGAGGGGGGLPIQATDLVVSVTTNAEFNTALANYWNYQFTATARYIIQFATGYVISQQIALENRVMLNLVMRSQTTTDVDCATFAANALGIKTPFSFINCQLGAFYGTFTSANGSTCLPMLVLGSTLDFWNGNLLAPATLNMSGFTLAGSNGGMKLFDWESRSHNIMGTTVTLDCHLDMQYCNVNGMKFKIGGGSSQMAACSGSVQIETTAGADGLFYSIRSNLTMYLTHSTTATYTFVTMWSGTLDMFITGTAWTAKSGLYKIFEAGGATAIRAYFLNSVTWHPQAATDYFAEVSSAAEFSMYGGNLGIDTTVATPTFLMKVGAAGKVQNACGSGAGNNFPAGAYTYNGTTAMLEGAVTENGALVMSRKAGENGNGFLSVIPTEAGTTTPDYSHSPETVIDVEPADALTAATIDLINYTQNGGKVTLNFLNNTISGVTWAGGTFIGAPAVGTAGTQVTFKYRASNATFYRIG